MKFSKAVRVRKRHEYLRFFNQSAVRRFSGCVVFRIQNETSFARLGITVKSNSGSVIRNRIKREIRECFRQNQAKLKSFDYNVVVSNQQKLNHKSAYFAAKKVRQSLESIWSHEVLF